MARTTRRRDARGRPRHRSTAPRGRLDLNEMFTRILGAIDEYVYMGEILPDDGYELIFQGPCREQFLGLSGAHARTAVWADYVHPDDREHFVALHRSAATDGALDGEYRLIGADGVLRWVRDRGRVRREGGRLFLDGSVLDVTAVHEAQEALLATLEELEQARAEADRLGRLDPLTGAANRRVLPDLLDNRLLGPAVEPFAVLLLDIDRFKQINDAHGHGAGDAVLVETTRRIRAAVRDQDVVARVGGEEFLVLLDGVADEIALGRVATSIRLAVRATPVLAGETAIPVTASLGGALAGGALCTRETLLGAADRALYRAKQSGRDRIALYGELVEAAADAVISPELRLARALAIGTCAREGIDERHVDEVSERAARVAARMGASPAIVERCRLAGLVRDVGKISVPERVVLKPGPLDDSQWELMRAHPAASERLVLRIPELADLAAIVRHHHERFGGGGYPDGLAGEAIPLEARIVAAVDAFSAMTADRPYRAALATEQAVAELRRSAGGQLDPRVVAALLDELGLSRGA